MDIVFVTPPLSQEERYGVKFAAGGQTPSTGLAMLAAVCRQHGRAAAIIDAPALGMDAQAAADKILAMRPKYVGITAVTMSIYSARDVALAVRQKAPGVKIIVGGAHITAATGETVKRLGRFFDVAVIGEGESTIVELLSALDAGKSPDRVNGIAYFSGDCDAALRFTPPRELLKDLDSLPFPAWDMLPDLAEYYSPPAHTGARFPSALLVTSRGCPNNCTFCDNRIFGTRVRSHSAGYILGMIKHLRDAYGIKEIEFSDDNFLVFTNTVKQLCSRLTEEKIDITWTCAARINVITPDYLSILRKAGCRQIWFGLESGSDRVLRHVKKNTTVEAARKAVAATKAAGISPCGFFIIGFPTETEDEIKQTIEFLLKLPLDEFKLTHLVPYPGSAIAATAHEYGTFDDDWKKLNGWKTVFVPHGLSHRKLAYYSNLAYRRFYFRPRIILNYLRKLKSARALKLYFRAFLGLLALLAQKDRK